MVISLAKAKIPFSETTGLTVIATAVYALSRVSHYIDHAVAASIRRTIRTH
jgi:hypothetical protein